MPGKNIRGGSPQACRIQNDYFARFCGRRRGDETAVSVLRQREVAVPFKESGCSYRQRDGHAGPGNALPYDEHLGALRCYLVGNQEIDLARRYEEQTAENAVHVDIHAFEHCRQRTAVQIGGRKSMRGPGEISPIDGGNRVRRKGARGLRGSMHDSRGAIERSRRLRQR